MAYRLLPGKKHRKNRHESYSPGDVIDLTPTQAEAFADKFEKVEGSKPAKAATKPAPANVPEPVPPSTEHPKDLGGGWFELSDGEKVRGEDEALEAQTKIDEGKK